MPVTKPMKLISLMFDEDEKRQLADLAQRQNISLSHAIREGARLYLHEWQERESETSSGGEHVATT